MRVSNLFAILLLQVIAPVLGQAQAGYKWLADGGGPDYGEFAIDVDADAEGNIYLGGEFADATFLWDSTYSSNGNNDMFLAKFNPFGDVIWVQTLGGPQLDRIYGIDAGPDGSVFITGYGKIEINQPPPKSTMHSRDIIVARFDAQGNQIWGLSLDGDISSEGTDILGNGLGECYMSSRMETSTYFNNDTLVGNGGKDGMVVKFGTSGSHLWSVSMGGILDDEYYAIGMDGNENLVAGGYFQGTATSGGHTLTGVNGEEACLVKMDSSGAVLWAVGFTGPGNEKITGVRCAKDGSIYFCGVFDGSINVGGINLTATNSQDIFYGKANPNGSVVWAKRAGGSSLDFVEDLEIDANENVYIGGFYFGTFEIGNNSVTSGGYDDLYFAKIDSTGVLQLFETSHYFDTRDIFGIGVDKQENILVCGAYIGQLEFGTDTVQSVQGTRDLFVGKYASLDPAVILDSVTGLGGPCVDSALNFHYHLEGYFEANNSFTAELSSSTGSFTNPYDIANANTGIGGTLSGTVPLSAPNGNAYQARITGTSPVTTSNNLGPLTINGQLTPPLTISDDTVICNGSSVTPAISESYVSQIWSTGDTSSFTSIATPGPYWVKPTDSSGCTQTFSFNVTECVSNNPGRIGSILLYPNPGTGNFSLKIMTPVTGTWNVSVIDMTGKPIFQTQIESFGADWQENIDLSAFPNGIYFLRVEVDTYRWTRKLVLRK